MVTFVPFVPLGVESEYRGGRLSSLLSPSGRGRREKERRERSLSLYAHAPPPLTGRKGQKTSPSPEGWERWGVPNSPGGIPLRGQSARDFPIPRALRESERSTRAEVTRG